MKIKKKSIPSFLQKALAEAKKKAVIKKFFSPYLLYKSKKQKGAKNKKLKGISAHCVPLSHKKDFVEIKIKMYYNIGMDLSFCFKSAKIAYFKAQK